MSAPYWAIEWQEIESRVTTEKRLLVACDFDGTLSPIVARPEAARMPTATRLILQRLLACTGVSLAFVSGRKLSDLRDKVGLEGAIYCGNHGLEIEGPGFTRTCGAGHRDELAAALALLREATARMRGVIIEDKDFTATVHWRLAAEPERRVLERLVPDVVRPFAGLRLTSGKAVWEIRPRSAVDKGSALREILARTGIPARGAIFLGDDETDESGFAAIREGITICVGDLERTAARYRVRDVKGASAFLFWLLVKRSRVEAERLRQRQPL